MTKEIGKRFACSTRKTAEDDENEKDSELRSIGELLVGHRAERRGTDLGGVLGQNTFYISRLRLFPFF
jgi:hypothetical protein